ncbi:MAG: hypothetical protein WD042_11430 [Phycisphaeraceae bacterium]
MSQASPTLSKPVPSPTPAPANLSKAIEQEVERQPGEVVRCVRVFDDRYRCNWWVGKEAWNSTGKIIGSKFLRANMDGDKLVIQDLSGGRL